MVLNEDFALINNKIGIHQKCSQALFYFAFIKKDIGEYIINEAKYH